MSTQGEAGESSASVPTSHVGPNAASSPARSPVTWVLALCFLIAIDAGITKTSLLWGPTAFENSGGVRTVFPQTYQVARKIYAPENDADLRIAVLGNSRIALALKEKRLESELSHVAPALDAKVSNLAVFGSFMGDTQMLARHLPALDPSLVLLTVGAIDLIREPTSAGGGGPLQLLRIGWRESPVASSSLAERLDRWARTAWPLYRFREFTREAILDRVLDRPDPGPAQETFESRSALFRHLYADRADDVDLAYRVWERERTLEAYARYLATAGPEHFERGRERARSTQELTRETPSVRAFETLVGELSAAEWPTIIVLMPENPILAEDTNGEFHRKSIARRGAELVREIAQRQGTPVVDARAWLEIESFLDFDHPIINLDIFEHGLATAIARAFDAPVGRGVGS